MKCYFCGASNPENTVFCQQCGAVLSESQDDTQEEIVEKTHEAPTEEKPAFDYYKERLEKQRKIEEFEDMLYSKEMTRKEFQDRYMRQIGYVISLIFIIPLIAFLVFALIIGLIFSDGAEAGYNAFLLLIVGLVVYFAIRRYRKYGGVWTYGEYLRNNITGGNIHDYRWMWLGNWRSLLWLFLTPNTVLGLFVVYTLVSTFFEEGSISFEYIIILAVIVAGHTLMYIWLGTVYDRYKENGYLPKWLEFIQRF